MLISWIYCLLSLSGCWLLRRNWMSYFFAQNVLDAMKPVIRTLECILPNTIWSVTVSRYTCKHSLPFFFFTNRMCITLFYKPHLYLVVTITNDLLQSTSKNIDAYFTLIHYRRSILNYVNYLYIFENFLLARYYISCNFRLTKYPHAPSYSQSEYGLIIHIKQVSTFHYFSRSI